MFFKAVAHNHKISAPKAVNSKLAYDHKIWSWLKRPTIIKIAKKTTSDTADSAQETALANNGAGNIQAQHSGPTREQLLQELNSLIGLETIKETINEICAYSEICQKRQQCNLQTEPLVLHMIFSGNPGTGKTTVARCLGRILCAFGILSQGHLVEIERADLVGEYIGQTAHKTREHIQRAKGGILFIDEAYSLARGGNKDFGKEAIDTLVKGMEDNKNDLLIILAGYRREMKVFLGSNPGLKSRFPFIIDFPDYSIEQLLDISKLLLTQRQYELAEDAEKELLQLIARGHQEQPHSGNARMVRNLIEQAIRLQAVRLIAEQQQQAQQLSRRQLMQIKAVDLLPTEKTSRPR